MNVRVFVFNVLVFGALVLCGCDLQPKISSIPDSIGMFIEDRYPALLANPQSQPEIYNSAVTDYGVYASPELYGSANIDDYVLYASIDDYVLVPDTEELPENTKRDLETKTETKDIQSDEIIEEDDDEDFMSEYLIVPVYGGNTVIDENPVQEVKKQDEKKSEETKISDDVKKEAVVKQEKPIENQTVNSDVIVVERGDTLYSLSRKNNMTVAELAKINNLHEPYTLSVGQKLTRVAPKETPKTQETQKKIEKTVPNVISEEKVKQIKAEKAKKVAETKAKVDEEVRKSMSTKRVDVQEIAVVKGDTLYSLSRKYEIPVNDLAVMNKLSAPFGLQVGQKIKVPKLDNVQTRSVATVKKSVAQKIETKKTEPKKSVKTEKTKTTPEKTKNTQVKNTEHKVIEKKVEPQQKKSNAAETQKSSSKIAPRSSSKFSWPVRGKILSGFGPKNGGLVNDGINISAPMGTVVKAAENGVVAYAGNEVRGMGNLIILQHSDGWMTVYAHLNSMDVRRGTKVNVGQPIGKIGKTGKVDKPQLHFEIRKGKKAYNPTQYLKK